MPAASPEGSLTPGTTDHLDLSVVVACLEADETIGDCIASIEASCDGTDYEILVVHPSDPLIVQTLSDRSDHVVLHDVGPGALIPTMWSAGFTVSKGDNVAFTTGHFVVSLEWAGALQKAIADGAVGAGGPIALRPGAGLVGRAVYFLRYSAFMPPLLQGYRDEIAGDNAAYSRTALSRHSDTFVNGF